MIAVKIHDNCISSSNIDIYSCIIINTADTILVLVKKKQPHYIKF